jgi:type I thyroxine 5'-deiodinase
MESNVRQHIAISSPRTADERAAVADSCVRNLHIAIPALLDDFRNTTDMAYTGWPDRLYAIDRAGRVAYKSGPGPFGFHPRELAAALARLVSQGQ